MYFVVLEIHLDLFEVHALQSFVVIKIDVFCASIATKCLYRAVTGKQDRCGNSVYRCCCWEAADVDPVFPTTVYATEQLVVPKSMAAILLEVTPKPALLREICCATEHPLDVFLLFPIIAILIGGAQNSALDNNRSASPLFIYFFSFVQHQKCVQGWKPPSHAANIQAAQNKEWQYRNKGRIECKHQQS